MTGALGVTTKKEGWKRDEKTEGSEKEGGMEGRSKEGLEGESTRWGNIFWDRVV